MLCFPLQTNSRNIPKIGKRSSTDAFRFSRCNFRFSSPASLFGVLTSVCLGATSLGEERPAVERPGTTPPPRICFVVESNGRALAARMPGASRAEMFHPRNLLATAPTWQDQAESNVIGQHTATFGE